MADDVPVKTSEAEPQAPVSAISFFGDAPQEEQSDATPAPRRKLQHAPRVPRPPGTRIAAAPQATLPSAAVRPESPKQPEASHESDDANSTAAEIGEDDRDSLLDSQEPYSQATHSTVSLSNFPESQSSGNPNPFELPKQGPGALVSRLVGVDHPDFIQGSAGGWKHPLQGYEILDTAFQTTPSDSQAAAAPSSNTSSEPTAPVTPAPYVPDVTPFELASAKPHPNAFFSPATYGWSIITPWPADSLEPAAILKTAKGACPGGTHIHGGKAHYFSSMPKMIDPKHVFNRLPSTAASQSSTSSEATPTDQWWLLHTCSACSHSVVCSPEGHTPMVVEKMVVESFEKHYLDNPLPNGKSPEAGLLAAWEIVWKIIDNALLRQEVRPLKVDAKIFASRIGWAAHSCKLFQALGFAFDSDASSLLMPKISKTNEQEQQTRSRLCRAWVEVGLIVLRLQKQQGQTAIETTKIRVRSCLRLSEDIATRSRVASFFGGDHIPKVSGSSGWSTVGKGQAVSRGIPVSHHYKKLGCTSLDPDSYVEFAFERLCLIDYENIPEYLSALNQISENKESSDLQMAVAKAKSSGFFSTEDIMRAYANLGFDPMAVDGKQYQGPVSGLDDQVIFDNWSKARDQLTKGQPELVSLDESFGLIARVRRSDWLGVALQSAQTSEATPVMSLEKAYKAFEAPAEIEDTLLMNIYQMAVQDAPKRQKEFDIALSTIAEHRNSAALKRFSETKEIEAESIFPEQQQQPVSADRPAGLENVGNTCYLNSLLQYFFTIRELRDIIMSYDQYAETPSSIPTKQKRVGGRLVSPAEIERARKFVEHLQTLFMQLVHTDQPSIRPDLELAYLALVTTQDEQEKTNEAENQQEKPAEGSNPVVSALVGSSSTETTSGTTDSMDIDEPRTSDTPIPSTSALPDRSIVADSAIDLDTPFVPSVEDQAAETPLDKPDTEMTSSVALDSVSIASSAPDPTTSDLIATELPDGITEIAPPASTGSDPPPLPPRKKVEEKKASGAGEMMFGKQHDVSECMDNVVFQIEAALDPEKLQAQLGDSAMVQKLFYGKTRQTLDFDEAPEASRSKEETFSYLLVDVAEEGRDLYDGLDLAFEPSAVEIEGHKAKRKVGLLEAPPVLQIQLQRVQFNRLTSRVFKSHAHLSYPSTIRLDRYFEIDPADTVRLQQLEEVSALREKLNTARQNNADLSSPEAAATANNLALLGSFTEELAKKFDDPMLDSTKELDEEAKAFGEQKEAALKELKDLREQIDSVWNRTEAQHEYELASVFMHRGEATFGHYYLHQRALPSQPDRWLKFNDQQVTDIPAEDVFADTTHLKESPYWLTYVRKGQMGQPIVDAVHRVLPS